MTEINERAPFVVAAVPHGIEADWGPHAHRLAGFPLNLIYAAVRDADDGAPAVAACTYWFAPDTYAEDPGRREMWYRPRHASPYRVCVAYDKRAARWETLKYRAETVVAIAEACSYDLVMQQTTLVGLAADEPADVEAEEAAR